MVLSKRLQCYIQLDISAGKKTKMTQPEAQSIHKYTKLYAQPWLNHQPDHHLPMPLFYLSSPLQEPVEH